MSSLAITRVSVPSKDFKDVARFNVYQKTGNINIILTNETELDVINEPREGVDALVQFWHSEDGVTYTQITVSDIRVRKGAQKTYTLLTHFEFVKIRAKTDGPGGAVLRADYQFEGRPMLGQIDIDPDPGAKQGFGLEGGTGPGIEDGSTIATQWPESN
jgi:hypothetical protein